MDGRALKKTVPFVSKSAIRDGVRIILIDNFEVPIEGASAASIIRRLSNNLAINCDQMVSSATAVALIADQIECCLEFIYSADYWSELRKESSRANAAAYVIEFFHFVRASSFHMGAAQLDGLSDSNILNHIAAHTIEEEGHEHFYVNALKAMGLSESVIYSIRPLPTTIELICVVRALAQMSPLTALACGAFMEGTSKNAGSVEKWHELVVSNGHLPAASARSIFQHVVEDEKCGHADSWKSLLLRERFVTPQALCDALNAITILAEMIRRWFDSLLSGLSDIGIQIGVEKSNAGARTNAAPPRGFSVHRYCSSVVHPRILDQIVYDRQNIPSQANEISSYFFPQGAGSVVLDRSCGAVVQDAKIAQESGSVFSALDNWSVVYRDHSLWSAMAGPRAVDCLVGLIHELWFLCRSLNRSIGLAASSTSDNRFRLGVLKNWTVLRQIEDDLARFVAPLTSSTPTRNRPLPSTVALNGAMTDLAHSDVYGYTIALHFLNGVLKLGCRHASAFEFSSPAMAADFQSSKERLNRIAAEGFCVATMLDLQGSLNPDAAHSCGPVISLAWSFLDGVRTSYLEGHVTAFSRIGWHVR